MAKTTKKTASEQINLPATSRKETGKQVRTLRKNGFIPANIYGQGFKSLSITLGAKDFQNTHKQAHETGLVYIQVEKDSIPTLIAQIQYHPVTDSILHVDFRKVNLKQKIETPVPIQIVGESHAVNVLTGVLLTQTDHLLVEALPTDIPQSIEVDISVLKEIGQDIKVSDLKKSDKYEIKDEADKVIVSVTAHKEESIVPDIEQAAAPEITTAKAPEEGAEGEVGAAPAAEGQAPAPEEKKEEKK